MEYLVLILQTIVAILIVSIALFLIKEVIELVFGMKNINTLEHARNANLNNALHNIKLNPTLDYTYGIASCKVNKSFFKNLFTKKIKIFEFTSQSRPHGPNAWV